MQSGMRFFNLDLYVEIDESYPDFKQQKLISEYENNYISC